MSTRTPGTQLGEGCQRDVVALLPAEPADHADERALAARIVGVAARGGRLAARRQRDAVRDHHHAAGRAPLVLAHHLPHGARVDRHAIRELVRQPRGDAPVGASVAVEAALAHQRNRPAAGASRQRSEEVALEEVAVHDLDVARREVARHASHRGERPRAQHRAADAVAPHGHALALEHAREVAGVGGRTPHLERVAVAVEAAHDLEEVPLRSADAQVVDHVGDADHAVSAAGLGR
jgi:hypothetical protein